MNYKVEGNGETLVFLHGLSDNLLYWEFLASSLKDDYQVIRLDFRGHGESELDDDEITIGQFANDLTNLLEELDVDKINLIGFSLGGAVALDFAVKYPEKVSSLVLMSSFFKINEGSEKILIQLKDALESSFEDFYDLILPKVLCPDVIDENKNELVALKEIASKTANTQAYIKAIDACLDFDVEDRLCEIDIPTLILAGKYDGMFELDTQIQLQSKIKDSKLIVFDNVKHNLLVGENNLEILEIIKNFIKKESK